MFQELLERILSPNTVSPNAGEPQSLLIDRDGTLIRPLIQVAVAVLLSDAAAADGAAARSEFDVVIAALQEHTAFSGTKPEDLTALLTSPKSQGENRERLFQEIRWRLDAEQRMFVAALVWEVLLADAILTPSEEQYGARLEALLGLSGEQLHVARDMASRGRTHWPRQHARHSGE